jgi:uroporphyrinogen-III synthase
MTLHNARSVVRSVVITRPRAQAETLARKVSAAGRDVIVFPLLDIRPLADPAPLAAALNNLDRYAMVAFVSPNAIDAAFALLSSWPRQVAIAVMGDGSRQALERHGVTAANATIISSRDTMRTDSQTLIEALDFGSLTGKQVLVIRGETGRELLGDALRAAGAQVTQIAAYRRLPPVLDDAARVQLRQLVDGEHDWIVTSSEALRILVRMVEQTIGAADVVKMQQQTIIVPHARIAETAQTLGFKHVILTGSGDEQLLAALQFRP